MSKLTLTNITSGYGTTTAFNSNNNAIVTSIENTLSRDGTSPNQMAADLDMNGYRVINVLAQSGDGFIWFGPWVSGTVYSLNNIVSNSGSSYICKTAHTAGANFATDLAAVKWQIISAKGDSGAGTGDMLIANNLSELTTTKTTARGNISAAASGANTDITSLSAPALGAATATTQAPGDNTTKVATTAFVVGSIPVIASSTEVSTGTDNVKMVTALAAQGLKGRLISFTSINATNAAWAPNALTTKMYVECIAGGGGGAGGRTDTGGGGGGGGGGGAGGISEGWFSSVSGTYAVVIGTGGNGGAANGVGTAGTLSSFGTLLSSPGQSGGIGTSSSGSAGGKGGLAYSGGNGTAGAGSGGLGGVSGNGQGAAGGTYSNPGGTGTAGTVNTGGGGGGGGGGNNAGAGGAGGAGGSGVVRVWEFA